MNIASNETQSLDVTGRWLSADQLHINIRLNDDDTGDTEIDYVLDPFDLAYLIQSLESFSTPPLK